MLPWASLLLAAACATLLPSAASDSIPTPLPTAAPTPLCGRGEFLDGDSCEPCEAGKYRNDSLPPTVCTLCAPGTYRSYSSDPSNALACLSCAAGSYTGVDLGATECESCGAGLYSATESINCSTCPAGTVSTTRSEACVDCPAGYFNENTGSSTCLKCSSEFGAAYDSTAGASSCDQCVAGYYMDDDGICVACPNGVDCDTAGSTLAGLEIEPGFYRFTASSTDVYECDFPNNCKGGSDTAGDELCHEGSGGPLCAQCDTNYFLDTVASTCTKCQNLSASVSFKVFLAVVLVVLALAGAVRTRSVWAGSREEIHFDLPLAKHCVGVFITTTQTLTLLISNHEAAGGKESPTIFRTYMALFNLVNINLLSFLPGVGCAIKGFEADLFFVTGSFLAGLAVALLLWERKKRFGDPGAWKILKTLIWVCKLALPAVSQVVFQTFRCASYDSGEFEYLLVDHSIDCSSASYNGLLAYASVMLLLFPIGMPLLALVQLVRLRPHFRQFEDNPRGLQDYEKHPVLSCSAWAPIFATCRPQFASWFEVADIVRRLALTCVTVLFRRVNDLILFSFSVAFLSSTAHGQLHPFEAATLNALASAEHAQILLCVVMLLSQDAAMFDSATFNAIGVVLMLMHAGTIGVLVHMLLPSRNQLATTSHSLSSLKQRFSHVPGQHTRLGGIKHDTDPTPCAPATAVAVPGAASLDALADRFAHSNPLHTAQDAAPAAEEGAIEMVVVDLEPPSAAGPAPAAPPRPPSGTRTARLGRRSSIGTIAAHSNRMRQVDLGGVGKRERSTRGF